MKRSRFSNHPRYKPYTYRTLKGRYFHLPAASSRAKRTFVLVYGQHATLERIQPIAEALTKYGDVYAVDNPGFGGMDPSYKIKQYPSLEFYAGHLKHFLDEHVPSDRSVTLLGISFGFQMVTQLLAQYPEVLDRVEQTISFVGFVHPKDFRMPKRMSVPLLYVLANSSRTRTGSKLIGLFMKDPVIIGTYQLTKPIQVKLKGMNRQEAKVYVREQAWLWRINDHRTHGATAWDFFRKNDLTKYTIDAHALHIGVPNDHIFDNNRVAEEFKQIFTKSQTFDLALDNHAPLDIDTPEQVQSLLPPSLRQLFATSVNKKAVTA